MNLDYALSLFAVIAIVSISHKESDTSLKAVEAMTAFTSKAIDVIRKMFNKK